MKLVSGIIDSGFFAQSALSAEVATKDSLGRNISETYLTGVDLTPYQTTAGMTAYANSAEVTGTAQYGLTTAGWSEITGGGVTGDYELSAGSGISIVDYPLEQKTVISVTAQGGNPEVEQAVIDNSATWNDVSAKLDTTAFSDVSGTFLTAHQDLSDYQTTADMVNYQPISSMTAYQSAGDYATTAQLADKVDSSAIGIKTGPVDTVTGISGTYISAWTANNASYATKAWSATRAKNDENDVPITSYLRTIPGTYLQNTDLSTEDGKVTAISGIPLSAGGDVPEGVMVESGLEYNAVNEISGYNGSAIAQYGAEKQFLTHDDTLCHISNSAQYALGCNVPVVAQQMGVDRTLLFSASTPTSAAELSESLYNFESLKFYIDMGQNDRPKPVVEIQPNPVMTISWGQGVEKAYYTIVRITATDDTHIRLDRGKSINLGTFTATAAETVTAQTGAAYQNVIRKIYGIGRIQ